MRKYRSVFANSFHQPIKSLGQIKNFDWNEMALYCDGVLVGHGVLRKQRRAKNALRTGGTEIFDKFRRQGHGIQLYIHLIKHARRLGVERIYSDTRLNKLSRRMWSEKLVKLFVVKERKKRGVCRVCARNTGYYIQLKPFSK